MKRKTGMERSTFAEGLTPKSLFFIVLGAMLCSFGIHNIHQRTGITEGGIIGLMLLLEHWLGISPSSITPVLDALCYAFSCQFLGRRFIKMSAVATVCLTVCYRVWEQFPPMLPDLSGSPLLAAVLGGIFVGLGVGLIVRQGGSCGGDDALALTIRHVFRWRLSHAYMLTDFLVLGLSLSYIPFSRIAFSGITVTVSSGVIDRVTRFSPAEGKADPCGKAR